MAIIIVHGTHDRDGDWWLETTPGSFAEQLDGGLIAAGADPDVWRIADELVGGFAQLLPEVEFSVWSGRKPPIFEHLGGRFRWTGANAHGFGRIQAGIELARYLETLSEVSPGEPIDIVAHSHGCNVVKQATQELQFQVPIGRIVFLACPHFVNAQDHTLPYRLNVDLIDDGGSAFPVLNLYSEEDTVQTSIASTLPELALPQGLPKVDWLGFEGAPMVNAFRSDQDPEAAHLYEELEINFNIGSGIQAHGAVHAPSVGWFLGFFLAQEPNVTANDCLEHLDMGGQCD
jgi:hypothetical protein